MMKMGMATQAKSSMPNSCRPASSRAVLAYTLVGVPIRVTAPPRVVEKITNSTNLDRLMRFFLAILLRTGRKARAT